MKTIPERHDMRFRPSILALAAVLVGIAPPTWGAPPGAEPAQAANTLTEAEKREGWVLLFDGRTLNGWLPSENPDSFSVRDGMIVAHASGTAIKGQAPHPKCHLFYVGPVGKASFTDFEFQADVMTEPESNSGFYFHTQPVQNDWPQRGFEVQINSYQNEKRKTGSLYKVADITDSLVPDKQWFRLGVTVRGKRVVVQLNGKTVVDWTEPAGFVVRQPPYFSDRKLSSGTFALQAHDPKSTVYFRNIRVKPLDAPAWGEAWVNPPEEAVPGVEHHSFPSASMLRGVGYNIYLPPGYAQATDRRYPVIYHLHGFGDTESRHLRNITILDEAIRKGEVPPMILIYAFGGRTSFYADSPDRTVMSETCIIHELIPHVDKTYRTIPTRAGRAIHGWSMGGAGALKFAFKHPDLFSSVVANGPGMTDSQTMQAKYNAVLLKMFGGDARRYEQEAFWTWIRKNTDRARGQLAVRVVIGTKDASLGDARKIHALLDELNFPHEFEEVPDVPHRPMQLYPLAGLRSLQFSARQFR